MWFSLTVLVVELSWSFLTQPPTDPAQQKDVAPRVGRLIYEGAFHTLAVIMTGWLLRVKGLLSSIKWTCLCISKKMKHPNGTWVSHHTLVLNKAGGCWHYCIQSPVPKELTEALARNNFTHAMNRSIGKERHYTRKVFNYFFWKEPHVSISKQTMKWVLQRPFLIQKKCWETL